MTLFLVDFIFLFRKLDKLICIESSPVSCLHFSLYIFSYSYRVHLDAENDINSWSSFYYFFFLWIHTFSCVSFARIQKRVALLLRQLPRQTNSQIFKTVSPFAKSEITKSLKIRLKAPVSSIRAFGKQWGWGSKGVLEYRSYFFTPAIWTLWSSLKRPLLFNYPFSWPYLFLLNGTVFQ